MARLMSVMLTEEAVRSRVKTVTRRLGWWEDKRGRRLLHPGNQLTLCRKVQGRRAGEPLVRLAEVEVVEVHRQPLWHIPRGDVEREGFPGWDRLDFVRFFCLSMRCSPDTPVTRIEWRYL